MCEKEAAGGVNAKEQGCWIEKMEELREKEGLRFFESGMM